MLHLGLFLSVLSVFGPDWPPTRSSSWSPVRARVAYPLPYEICHEAPPGDPGTAVYSRSIDLSTYVDCGALYPSPFGARITPDGQYLYVALAGGYFSGSQNCVLAKIDTSTDQVVGSLSVGLFPEDIVFTRKFTGQMQYGFATNSSSSTVTVFNAQDQIVATIPIPYNWGSTAYPFGLAVSPDQKRVYVGTLDGSGNIYAINTSTLALVPGETLWVPDAHGRMAFYGNTLIVPETSYFPSASSIVFVDPHSPGSAVWVSLESTDFYPSAQDLAVNCEGKTFAAGYDLERKCFVLDAQTKSLSTELDTGTDYSTHQGLGLSYRGLLAVADNLGSAIAFFDSSNNQALGLLDLSSYGSGPNELVFTPNGNKLYVTMQYSDNVLVFDIQ